MLVTLIQRDLHVAGDLNGRPHATKLKIFQCPHQLRQPYEISFMSITDLRVGNFLFQLFGKVLNIALVL